jgi:hypothetical protein
MSLTPNVLHVSVQNASGLRFRSGRAEDTRSESVAPASVGGTRRTSDGCGSSGIRTVDDRLPQTVGPRGRARHEPCTDAARKASRFGALGLRATTATGTSRRLARESGSSFGCWRAHRTGGKAGPASSGSVARAPSGARAGALTIGRGREPATRVSVVDPAPARSSRAGGSSESLLHGSWPTRRRPRVRR